jgi:uncharacterized protein
MGLQKKTFLQKSNIAGNGLFAAESIKKGEVIWSFNPDFDKVFTPEDFSKIEGLEKNHLEIYCYKYAGNYILCSDNAKFINHSDNPNTEDTENETIAARDIEPGEEITSNYRTFGVSEEDESFNMSGLL